MCFSKTFFHIKTLDNVGSRHYAELYIHKYNKQQVTHIVVLHNVV